MLFGHLCNRLVLAYYLVDDVYLLAQLDLVLGPRLFPVASWSRFHVFIWFDLIDACYLGGTSISHLFALLDGLVETIYTVSLLDGCYCLSSTNKDLSQLSCIFVQHLQCSLFHLV